MIITDQKHILKEIENFIAIYLSLNTIKLEAIITRKKLSMQMSNVFQRFNWVKNISYRTWQSHEENEK